MSYSRLSQQFTELSQPAPTERFPTEGGQARVTFSPASVCWAAAAGGSAPCTGSWPGQTAVWSGAASCPWLLSLPQDTGQVTLRVISTDHTGRGAVSRGGGNATARHTRGKVRPAGVSTLSTPDKRHFSASITRCHFLAATPARMNNIAINNNL